MSGPSTPSPDDAVKIGYVRRAHGIKGAVIVRVLLDEFDQYRTGKVLATDSPDYPELSVVSAHPHQDGWLVTFAEISTRNDAEPLQGTSLLVGADDRRDLEDDEFWPEQLVGLSVVDTHGNTLGVVNEVIAASAQDRLVVDTGDDRVEVPFVQAIVTRVSISDGVVTIDPPLGLFGD